MIQPEPATQDRRGAALLVSYDTLTRIQTAQATIEAKLDACLALRGEFNLLATRVATLELNSAREHGSSTTRNTISAFVGGLVVSAIGGGALHYLPALIGGGH